MLEAASAVATLLVRLASAPVPLVLSAIAPLSALPVLVSVMVAPEAEVVNEEAPLVVTAWLWVRLPLDTASVSAPVVMPAVLTVPIASAELSVRLMLPELPTFAASVPMLFEVLVSVYVFPKPNGSGAGAGRGCFWVVV